MNLNQFFRNEKKANTNLTALENFRKFYNILNPKFETTVIFVGYGIKHFVNVKT